MLISYGGISQLFVAATSRPASPRSRPVRDRQHARRSIRAGSSTRASPSRGRMTGSTTPSPPARPRVSHGPGAGSRRRRDLPVEPGPPPRGGRPDLEDQAQRLLPRAVVDPLSPITFVDKIDVPVFLACQWTDEQTGGHCPALASRFTGTKRKWFTFANGVHADSLDPATFNRWFDFLELYVGGRRPQLPPAVRAAAPVLYASLLGVQGVGLPDDPIQQQPDYESALAAFEAQPPVRILFENGAGGAPGPRSPRSSSRSSAFRYRRRRPGRGISAAARSSPTGSGGRAPSASHGIPTRGRRRTSAATPGPGRAGSGRRRPTTTGRRAPRAARCPT